MRHLLLLSFIFLLLIVPHPVKAEISVWCGYEKDDLSCYAGFGPTFEIADRNAQTLCNQMVGVCEQKKKPADEACVAIARALSTPSKQMIHTDVASDAAQKGAIDTCSRAYGETCLLRFSACDPNSVGRSFQLPTFWGLFTHFDEIGTGISFGIGLILVLITYAKRAAIFNSFMHGNLPRTLSVYADDIEVLFKRSQRVNWYGRVVFGVTARLGMTEKQLSLVRRYWLGRVVAFDSLRRQRQNELARMHLQLAATMKAEPKDKKALSQILAFIKTILLFFFYLLRALFSFLFGFLFIRITIAKLARGKLIESKDLVLVLQAKEAIEETARYLKEYLTVAETFDGREELFESK